MSADAILSSIRQMRSERDLLRKAQKRKEKVAEDVKLRLANEEDLNKEHRSIEESCRALEEISGGRGRGESLAERRGRGQRRNCLRRAWGYREAVSGAQPHDGRELWCR